jgi:hypothetical protein
MNLKEERVMSYGGSSTKRRTTGSGTPASLAGLVASAAESIGLLNKGSAKAAAAPGAGDVANLQPISSNTLNVTRVGGVAALISAAGAAALVLFNVNKTTDRASIVVAAYLSVGAIVAAALVTVAIIVAADIRARTAVATTVSSAASLEATPEKGDVKFVQAVAAAPLAGGAPPDFVVSLDLTYDFVLVNAAAANVVLTLPKANSVPWRQMTIKRQDNVNNNVTIRPQSQETILGQYEHLLLPANPVQVYSNGQAWLAVQ